MLCWHYKFDSKNDIIYTESFIFKVKTSGETSVNSKTKSVEIHLSLKELRNF